jgi:hypothetical protein
VIPAEVAGWWFGFGAGLVFGVAACRRWGPVLEPIVWARMEGRA